MRETCEVSHHLICAIMIICNLDVNECASRLHNCDKNANCSNLDGSFQCDCKDGHFGNGTTCLSKDNGYL